MGDRDGWEFRGGEDEMGVGLGSLFFAVSQGHLVAKSQKWMTSSRGEGFY